MNALILEAAVEASRTSKCLFVIFDVHLLPQLRHITSGSDDLIVLHRRSKEVIRVISWTQFNNLRVFARPLRGCRIIIGDTKRPSLGPEPVIEYNTATVTKQTPTA